MSYSVKESLQRNIDSLKIVLEADGKQLSWRQIQKVKAFRGFGGIKAVLWNENETKEQWEANGASKQDIALYDDLQSLYELLRENLTGKQYRAAIESMRNSILTAFFTPEIIPHTFYSVLNKYHRVTSIYEPSAGNGVFIIQAVEVFDTTEIDGGVTCYEKDLLTGKVLNMTLSSIPVSCVVNIKAFEDSPEVEGLHYDLITSNIPYGNIPVYDPKFDKEITKCIHNYFFAKGLDKLKDSGVLAFLVSNAFLDTKGNQQAREYLFSHSDFISLTVMPDNLMWESAGTYAPSHFLVCRKRVGKTEMSADEKLLCRSEYMKMDSGVMCSMNCYIAEHPEIIIGDVKAGKNQYGKGAREVWWDGPIEGIGEPFGQQLSRDFARRYLKEKKEYELDTVFPGTQIRDLNPASFYDKTIEEPPGLASAYTGQGWDYRQDESRVNRKQSIPLPQLSDKGELNAREWTGKEVYIETQEEYQDKEESKAQTEHTCDECGTLVWDLSERFCPECLLAHSDEGTEDIWNEAVEQFPRTLERLEDTPPWEEEPVSKEAQQKLDNEITLELSDIPKIVKHFMPMHQQKAIVGSVEHWSILDRLTKIIMSMPGPYGQDGVPEDDNKIVYLHYFCGNFDWYITEKDEGIHQNQMFGYANLNDDQNAEWGYMNMQEFNENYVELDFFWEPKRFGDRLKTIGYTIEPTHEAYAVMTLADRSKQITTIPIEKEWVQPTLEQLNLSIPYKQNMIVKTVDGEIVKIISMEPLICEKIEMSKKEIEVMSKYLEIRDCYLQIELYEGNE